MWLDAVRRRSGGNDRCVAPEASKRNDGRLIIFATALILGVGVVLMAGLWLALRASNSSAPCSGSLVVGEVQSLRDDTKDGPILDAAPGSGCEFWAAQHDGKLLAVKTSAPSGCRVDFNPQRNTFICNGAVLAWSDIPTWPTRIVRNAGGTDSWQIDFG
jgi:hypothetical protein